MVLYECPNKYPVQPDNLQEYLGETFECDSSEMKNVWWKHCHGFGLPWAVGSQGISDNNAMIS